MDVSFDYDTRDGSIEFKSDFKVKVINQRMINGQQLINGSNLKEMKKRKDKFKVFFLEDLNTIKGQSGSHVVGKAKMLDFRIGMDGQLCDI